MRQLKARGQAKRSRLEGAASAQANTLKAADALKAQLDHKEAQVDDQLAPQRLLMACSAGVPKEQPRQCAQCVRFHQRQFPCPYL